MGHAFNSLPPLERARQSREMADALLDLSLNSQDTETIAAYLDLAADWLAQARGLERGEEANVRKSGSGRTRT